MKKLLLAIYIIFVVTASLASRAETVPPVKLETVSFEYNETAQMLRVVIQYPNQCIRKARVVLTPSEYENVLYVEVKASHHGFGCAKRNSLNATDIEIKDVSARELQAQVRRINHNFEGTYTLVSRDGSFEQTINFAEVNVSAFFKHSEISGDLLAGMSAK
jgi:hypothetical protein